VCSIMLVLGANFYATIVGNMALLVSSLNATSARHQQRADAIQEAMRYLKVSSPVQSRVQVCSVGHVNHSFDTLYACAPHILFHTGFVPRCRGDLNSSMCRTVCQAPSEPPIFGIAYAYKQTWRIAYFVQWPNTAPSGVEFAAFLCGFASCYAA
jgi:hypothetical protein